ncbi:hypothetical protein OA496_01190 [Pelagibacteraceae bacterium]|nr:hypothetical protein [Pelagibacteraceae bacterium]
MRQLNKTKKKGIFKKLFVKLSRLLGYELIDQADMSFVTSKDHKNPSISGKKSITLPLGELKITRKVQRFDIILKTCTSVNLVSQSKKRIFEQPKSEYTMRTINSLIKSIKKASKDKTNISFNITIIDAGSPKEDIATIDSVLKNSGLKFNIINLNLNEYLKRIKIVIRNNSQIENNMKSTMASIIKSFEIAKDLDDLVYFVEDDYIHDDESISEMISAYEKFSTILKDEIFIIPVDYPYLYQKNQFTNVLIGQKNHWRSVKESLLTFLTSKKMINKYYSDLIKMGEIEHEPYEAILHSIYDKENCFSPIPSLALHCTNVNSVFGLSPNINVKELWEKNKN